MHCAQTYSIHEISIPYIWIFILLNDKQCVKEKSKISYFVSLIKPFLYRSRWKYFVEILQICNIHYIIIFSDSSMMKNCNIALTKYSLSITVFVKLLIYFQCTLNICYIMLTCEFQACFYTYNLIYTIYFYVYIITNQS